MSRAIQLANKGQYTTHPNPRVGCVIVKGDQIIGEGFHMVAGEPHAEINALNSIKNTTVESATAYVTLEPCSHTGKTPPCANALIKAKVARVVIAMQDPNPQVSGKGIKKLEEAGIKVTVGVLEEQARNLNLGFIKRMEQGLPWVRLKMAMSLDGRTAMASGESQWITGADARRDVQRLRSQSDVILTGRGTVSADNPSLNVRTSADELGLSDELFNRIKQPTRVVLDSRLRLSPKAKLFSVKGSGDVLIYTCSNDEDIANQLTNNKNTKIKVLDKNSNNQIPLKVVLAELADQEFNQVHVEAGATLCGALIEEGLVDEIILYMAPTLMGSNARGLFNLPALEKMKDKIGVSIQEVRSVGDDIRLTLRIE